LADRGVRLLSERLKLSFISTEQELDSLIAAAHDKLAVFLQLLKETGMRAGET
jgi:integrase